MKNYYKESRSRELSYKEHKKERLMKGIYCVIEGQRKGGIEVTERRRRGRK